MIQVKRFSHATFETPDTCKVTVNFDTSAERNEFLKNLGVREDVISTAHKPSNLQPLPAPSGASNLSPPTSNLHFQGLNHRRSTARFHPSRSD